jgi:lipopolysaccharide/colanic/teichoic acid biosynthesis glycosyltransferase
MSSKLIDFEESKYQEATPILHSAPADIISPMHVLKKNVDLTQQVPVVTGGRMLFLTIKSLFDRIISGIGIILLSLLLIIVALLIWIESPGPVFFIQKRCGKNGKPFRMIKFRSMVADAESLQKDMAHLNETDSSIFKISNDARVTRLGKILRSTSIDELPQLFNVLKGDMSLVGPRPLIMDEMSFNPTWRKMRLSVKPGITGLWQVEARGSGLSQDWIKYDLYYVKHQSFCLDFKLLLKTVKVVLLRKGAC